MDQTGMGEKPVEDAKRRYPGRVDGVSVHPCGETGSRDRWQGGSSRTARFASRRAISAPRAISTRPRRQLDRPASLGSVPIAIAAGHADRFWAALLGITARTGKVPATLHLLAGR